MPRQGNHGERDTRSVNWVDVASMLQSLHNAYEGLFIIVYDIEGARNAAGALWVRVLYYPDGKSVGKAQHVVCKLWPSNAHRTMAGMVFNLLHSMDHVVDQWLRSKAGSDVPF